MLGQEIQRHLMAKFGTEKNTAAFQTQTGMQQLQCVRKGGGNAMIRSGVDKVKSKITDPRLTVHRISDCSCINTEFLVTSYIAQLYIYLDLLASMIHLPVN